MASRRFAFVLWLWIETDAPDTGHGMLRGSLEVVGVKQIRYFTSLDQLPQLLREITGWPDAANSGQRENEETDE